MPLKRRPKGFTSWKKPPDFFATPSPRLIPKGEKPDTFTCLALALYEGCT
jgi:hypothetical protein